MMSYMELIEHEIDKLAHNAERRRGFATAQEVALMADLLYICRHYCDKGTGDGGDAEAPAMHTTPANHAERNPY